MMFERKKPGHQNRKKKSIYVWFFVFLRILGFVCKGSYTKGGSLQVNPFKTHLENIAKSLNILGIKGTRHSDIKRKRLSSVAMEHSDIALLVHLKKKNSQYERATL